jgi:alginate O-acetyltransferase complex protein AlgI
LALVVLASAAFDYVLARGMDASTRPRWRTFLVTLSITANLGLLCYFKYANFFLDSLATALRSCGMHASLPVLSVILPVGISFYTFEAINYTVDVYRRRIRAETNLSHFLLFILFFPHLVAGPIVRAGEFLPQIARPKQWNWVRMQLGVWLFILGLLKKWVLGDRMALFADPVFAHPEQFRQGAIWIALIAYALQIYGDFSGYSDMAIGLAHLLGYRLTQNFNMPYLSANMSEFWRRWHMSLSSWLRDYLFIPLGGSRGGLWQTCRNLLITMTLGGLWHGANWTFVLWGVAHGLLLIGHRLFQELCKAWGWLGSALSSLPGTVLRVGITFLTVSLLWVLFRCQTLAQAVAFYRALVVPQPGNAEPMPAVGLALILLGVAFAHFLGHHERWRWLAAKLPAPVLGTVYAVLFTLALLMAPGTEKTFIYFQF